MQMVIILSATGLASEPIRRKQLYHKPCLAWNYIQHSTELNLLFLSDKSVIHTNSLFSHSNRSLQSIQSNLRKVLHGRDGV